MSDASDAENVGEVEVTNWLKSIKLPQYTTAFLSAGFDDLEVLAHLTEADLDALPNASMPPGHKKKILLKARDLGSATLRGHYSGGVYQPPAKSLITSAQLAEIKAAEQLAKARRASGLEGAGAKALSPAKADELRLALKTEVLRDLQREGFEVNESLKKASADLVAIRSQLDDEDDIDGDGDGESGGASASIGVESSSTVAAPALSSTSSTGVKSKRSAATVGKKLKRKKALQSKKAAVAAATGASADSGETKGTRRKRTVSREGMAMANAAAAAAESGKPLPMKVFLPDRPDEPMIFSIYHTNTVQELVTLAARSLDLLPSDYALRQLGPNGATERCDANAFPLAIVRAHGADAALYRFELVPRSKAFVRFYHEKDSAKFHTLEIDGETEAGDLLEKLAEKSKVPSDTLTLWAVTGDRRRELAEFELMRSVIDQASSRGADVTFVFGERRDSPDSNGGSGAASPSNATTPNATLTAANSEVAVRGPFWNTMLAGIGGGGGGGSGAATSSAGGASSVQATLTVQHDNATDRWVISTRKSLREQMASLASKFSISDIHNYDFYLVDTSQMPAGRSVPPSELTASQKLNINVPIADVNDAYRLVLVVRGERKVLKPNKRQSMPAGRKKHSAHGDDSSSTEETDKAAVKTSRATKTSILKAFGGGADSDVTSDSASGKAVSFGKQATIPM